jgi:hypothetical protein
MASERAFRQDPSSWLPQPYDHSHPHAWHLYLWAGKVGLLVETWIGECRREQDNLCRQIQLEPDRSGFIGRHAPSFTGDLILTREGGSTVVVLEGRYRPPYGPLGDLLDRLVMRFLARATTLRFVAEAAARLATTGAAPAPVKLPEPDLVF